MPSIPGPKTVVVLGAGASVDFEFPVGNSLVNRIIHNLQEPSYTEAIKRILFNNAEYIQTNNLLQYLPTSMHDHFAPSERFKVIGLPHRFISEWANHLHHVESIDQFIYYRKEHSLIARICILLTLSHFENPGFFQHTLLENGFMGVKRTWYHSLWTNIISTNPSLDELKKTFSNIHFITFNYDRSLEFFLLKAIKALYPDSDIAPNQLPITHVYGTLGSMETRDANYRLYSGISFNQFDSSSNKPIPYRYVESNGLWGTEFDDEANNAHIFRKKDESILKWAMGIDTYNDVYDSSKAGTLQELICQAKNVYFFGFAFLDQNMKILIKDFVKLNNATGRSAQGTVDATSFKLPLERANFIRDKMGAYFQHMAPGLLSPERKQISIGQYFADSSIRILTK